jgi:hypothetical protein
MRFTRSAVALAAGLALLVAGSAHAAAKKPAPRPVCHLITDDANDADDPFGTGVHLLAPLNDANIDIVGGDFATDGTYLTTVLTVAHAPGLDPHSPQGDFYLSEFQPSASANVLYLEAVTDATGAATYTVGHITEDTAATRNFNDDPGIPVKGKITGGTITMSVKLSALKSIVNIKPGAKINGIMAETFGGVTVGPPVNNGLLLGGDDTDPLEKPYLAGTPSCVKPVK